MRKITLVLMSAAMAVAVTVSPVINQLRDSSWPW